MLKKIVYVLAFASLLLMTAPAFSWEAMLVDSPMLPPSLVVVNKSGRQLFYLVRHSPLVLWETFPSIHGQFEGDKFVEGDLRTPEGVYFITGRIRGALDFEEYGSQAHALNYPNPVDRLRGKTGSGIWIHSKGQPIANQTTKGCIAVDLDAIDVLAPYLSPGTPVLVAENVFSEALGQSSSFVVSSAVQPTVPATDAIASLLTQKTEAWNNAWASRSKTMFDFYDPESYEIAQSEAFVSFRSQKESLFSRLPWIQIQHGDIHVLQGPGYWVTWFEQYYRAPNLAVEGIRRLYWQPVKDGELKIVGMEWLPQDLGLERAFLNNLTPSAASFVEDWRKAWERGDLEAYCKFYADNAVQDNRRGLQAIRDHKARTWGSRRPASVDLYGIRVRLQDRGVRLDMTQIYKDTSGYQDRGVKELLLYPDGDSWRIATETWSRN